MSIVNSQEMLDQFNDVKDKMETIADKFEIVTGELERAYDLIDKMAKELDRLAKNPSSSSWVARPPSPLDEIQRQRVFVSWLKSKGIYNPMHSATTMQAMQKVWEVQHVD